MVHKVVLLATGLGKVNRGFETYIHDLATLLNSRPQEMEVTVLGGGKKIKHASYRYIRIPCIYRNSKLAYFLSRSSSKRLRIERRSFFVGMIPFLAVNKCDAIYLGEYPVYCWLFKLRKITPFKFALALYTGGQAFPGAALFNPSKDFIHHVTDVYQKECAVFPAGRQKLLPHFLNFEFSVDKLLENNILEQAKNRRIILSVGALEKSSKRMHWLVDALSKFQEPVFPILLGTSTADTPEIKAMLKKNFGEDGYIMTEVPRKDLGTYYHAANAFVLCSPKESFGLVLLKALSFGLPVMCANFPEASFVLKNNALLVPMNSPEDVLAGLNKLEAFAAAKSQGQRKSFASLYSLPLLSQGYFDMFGQILNSGFLNDKVITGKPASS